MYFCHTAHHYSSPHYDLPQKHTAEQVMQIQQKQKAVKQRVPGTTTRRQWLPRNPQSHKRNRTPVRRKKVNRPQHKDPTEVLWKSLTFGKHSSTPHQQRKDDELRKEATRQDQRWRSLQHQFGLLQEEVRRGQRGVQQDPEGQLTTITAAAAAARTRIYRPVAVAESTQETEGEHVRTAPAAWPRLPQLKDMGDIEHYFVMFERLALAARWPRADWAYQLVPMLEGSPVALTISVTFLERKTPSLHKIIVMKPQYWL
ncbi:hypothetical protein SRHO_G00140380 [Serrasalmus rhombeus]